MGQKLGFVFARGLCPKRFTLGGLYIPKMPWLQAWIYLNVTQLREIKIIFVCKTTNPERKRDKIWVAMFDYHPWASLECILAFYQYATHPWGYSSWKEVRGCAALKTPFSCMFQFQFFKTPFSTKITNFIKFGILQPKFPQNFHSKALNSAKIQFFKPYFFQKFCSLSPIFPLKISSLSPYFGAYPFLKPPFAALWAAQLYQNESWVPPEATQQYSDKLFSTDTRDCISCNTLLTHTMMA